MANVIDVSRLCVGCMSLLEDAAGPCPKCGYIDGAHGLKAHQLRPKSILSGKYLTGRALGEGGFGITYLGLDLKLDIRVAIKEYFPVGFAARDTAAWAACPVRPAAAGRDGLYEAGLERFLLEAKSVAKFASLPGIVAVRDFFRENGTAYIVTEYISGITLMQHLENRGGRLRPNEAFELMRPVIKSLAQVHAAGVIHGDIGPDSFMLTNKGEIKLLDFGAARDFLNTGERTYSVPLKPGYAPVEQYQNRGVQGPFTDVYALCATLYKMITGRTPPESPDRPERDTLIPPSALGIRISPQAERALMKGLAVNRQNRYRSAGALYEDLYGPTQSLPQPRTEGESRAAEAIEKAVITTVSGRRAAISDRAAANPAEAGKAAGFLRGKGMQLLFLAADAFALFLSVNMATVYGSYIIPLLIGVCVNTVYRAFTFFRKRAPSPPEHRIHAAVLSVILVIAGILTAGLRIWGDISDVLIPLLILLSLYAEAWFEFISARKASKRAGSAKLLPFDFGLMAGLIILPFAFLFAMMS